MKLTSRGGRKEMKPKHKNKYKVSYRLEPYRTGIFMIRPREKSTILQANTKEHAKQRLWEYHPKTFFDYGEYKITKVEKVFTNPRRKFD